MNILQLYAIGCLVSFVYFEIPFLGGRMDRITEITTRETDPELIRELGMNYIKHFMRLLLILTSWVWVTMALVLEVSIVWRMITEGLSYKEAFERKLKK